jgi:cell division protein FtsL
MKEKNRLRFKDVFLFIIILMAGVTSYLWTRLQVFKLGYEHQRVSQIKKKLIEENRQLSLKYAELVAPARLEHYAQDKLGLKKPDEKQLRYIK